LIDWLIDLLIDWLVFRFNFSSISAISLVHITYALRRHQVYFI
jgi:hypothetical protein